MEKMSTAAEFGTECIRTVPARIEASFLFTHDLLASPVLLCMNSLQLGCKHIMHV